MDGHVLMDMNEVITQAFSSSHKAVDVVGTGNSVDDVIAISDGTVEIVVNTVTGNRKGSRGTASYGNFVKIRHDNGMKTLYAHMAYGSVSVKAGDRISKGQKIGRMGDTGNAYGVHLHFEVRQSNEKRINPYPYLFEGKQIVVSKNEEKIPDESPALTSSDSNENSLGETKEEKNEETKTEPILENKNVSDKVQDEKSEIVLDNDSIGLSEINNTVDNSNLEIDNNPDDSSISYLSNSEHGNGSIVDGLKSIGADSSFDYRTLLAYENGIHNYRGSYEQNVKLLSLLKQGKLKKA